MIRFGCLLLLISSLNHARADSELKETVPVELAKAIYSASGLTSPNFYSDVLDAFPPLDIPPDFAVLGSAVTGLNTHLVLSTERGAQFAIASLSQLLTAEGALPYPPYYHPQTENGFQHAYAENLDSLHRFCSDKWGDMSISYRETPSLNSVVISTAGLIDPSPCSARVDQAVANINQSKSLQLAGLRRFLPKMELPNDQSPVAAGVRSSGSQGIHRTHTRLVTDLSMEDLYTHLSTQIETQGWQLDTAEVATPVTSASWTNTLTQGSEFLGTLTIERVSDSGYVLYFEIEDKNDRSLAPAEPVIMRIQPGAAGNVRLPFPDN